MKINFPIIIFLIVLKVILLFNVFVVNAQTDTIGKERYTITYKIKEGIFISFDQLLLNKPLSFERVISGDKNDDNWYSNIFKNQKIVFLDDYGIQQTVETKQLWGYCRNGAVYVNYNNDFYRVPYIGKISHYVATQTIRVDNGFDPYYNYSNTYMPSYETSHIVQNLIDFENGKSFPFTLETVQAFISKDSDLFNEFNLLKQNKKKQMMFLYIRRYNERNPLYLPIQ